ncbi:MAG: hypothetical protein ACFFDI_15885 [Promethearchaeota archaeon]
MTGQTSSSNIDEERPSVFKAGGVTSPVRGPQGQDKRIVKEKRGKHTKKERQDNGRLGAG